MKIYFGLGVLLTLCLSVRSQCPGPQSPTFMRWLGAAPARPTPVFVYTASGDEPSLPGVCLNRCRELDDCAAVIVSYGKGVCTGVAQAGSTELVSDNQVSYFEKVCLELPQQCQSRWWVVEAVPGYHLNSEAVNVKVTFNVTMRQCYQDLLIANSGGTVFRSAQWVRESPFDPDRVQSPPAALGSCVMNQEDRVTEPEAYRVATYNTVYLEDQCRHDYKEKIERCSYEEYYNQTLQHVDFTINNVSKDQCRSQCESEARFVCRGFSWSSLGLCDLHSEELVASGSWLLRRTTDTTFYRRVVCLQLSVECNATHLTITYRPRTMFRGRLYVAGAGDREDCGVPGTGGAATLNLPLNGTCDVHFAHAITETASGVINRTMAYAVVVVQHNRWLQTAGDRWVRAGCAPPPPHTLTAALAVANSQATSSNWQTSSPSAVYNSPGAVTVSVVGEGVEEGAAATAAALGQPMQLTVETTDENEIEIYHLVASSRLGDSSVLLLDSRGCPTGQVDFPPFTRSWTATGAQRLTARFKAFRFPSSNVVRFTMMVRRCDGKCPLMNCSQANRSARMTNSTSESKNEPYSANEVGDDEKSFEELNKERRSKQLRMPLEVELFVGSKDLISADSMIHADHQNNELAVEGEGGGAESALVCVHELVVVCLALAALAAQLLLLLACCVLLNRYRTLAKMSMQKDYQSFDNVGFDTLSTHRRVHWPDQNVDILHAH